jgi:hypothetical protein
MTLQKRSETRRINAVIRTRRPHGWAALWLSIAAIAALALPVSAHHGNRGRFDVSKPYWVEGVITRVYFGQPHPLIAVRTQKSLAAPAKRPDIGVADAIGTRTIGVLPDTRGREVEIEFSAIPLILELDGKIKPGDRIALIVFRNCDAPHQLRGQWLQLGSNAPIARPGPVTRTQVEGC